MENKVLVAELNRLASECRLQSKGLRPQLALMRMADSLRSLACSLSSEEFLKSPLTKREQEILLHVSQGFTNREIASAFGISDKTIEFHLKSIFHKTEATTRAEAVVNAIKNNWLTTT